MQYNRILIYYSLFTAVVFLCSCKKNKLNGVWLHKKQKELIWLNINHHQYILKTETLPHRELLMHKEGKIVYRDDSIQFVPAKIFDRHQQKWLLDYDRFRPVYYVQLSGDSLILSNAKETLAYYRESWK